MKEKAKLLLPYLLSAVCPSISVLRMITPSGKRPCNVSIMMNDGGSYRAPPVIEFITITKYFI